MHKKFWSSPTDTQAGKKRIWHLSGTKKIIITVVIIVTLLVSMVMFIPKSTPNVEPPINGTTPSSSPTSQATSNPSSSPDPLRPINVPGSTQNPLLITPKAPGVVGTAKDVNSTVWMAIAQYAWNFFQPGVGVSQLGLPYSGGVDYPAFTDWDLGSYIQAVIAAEKIGLIGVDGAWGSSGRFEKVVTFLETRELNATTNYPFWFYDATTGRNYREQSDLATSLVDGADAGRLLLALNNLKIYNSSLADRINYVVYTRSDYHALVQGMEQYSSSNGLYAYFIISGFACFWPQELGDVPSKILTNVFNSGNITTFGVELPKAPICNEPLLSSLFEINNADHERLLALTQQVILATEAFFAETGHYMAPSEGLTTTRGWLYGWVVGPNGKPWTITNSNQNTYYDYDVVTPCVYTKVGFSFLALANSTFTKNMCIWLENMTPDPLHGYYDGADWFQNSISHVSSNGNAIILDAALYALQK
ncbi:MAG: DUF3131 domain-containing protein [Candidatus Bathyarchaeota archaeon]|nr:DUF3131 domain-containing protein [Candidatus Bathyarchaeota archaeon]